MTSNIRAQYTDLTGEELGLCLQAVGVTPANFARHTGRNKETIRRWLLDRDDIPLWVDFVLMLYHVMPETTKLEGRLNLPLEKWGISRPSDDQ